MTVSKLFYMGAVVAFEEKRSWIMLVTSIAGYVPYLVIVLGRLGDVPVGDVAYADVLLWSIGGAIGVNIVINIVVGMFGRNTDTRDREIRRVGDYIGQSFVVIGGVSALIMALLELDYFWIANVIYLCFVLSAILGGITKVIVYRQSFPQW